MDIKHARAGERFRKINLEWPLEYDGKVFGDITLRRLTAAEVAAFVERLDGAKKFRFPMFFDEGGSPIPDEVLDALDDDDTLALDAACADFLPRRFREMPEPTLSPARPAPESAPSDGDTIAPS